MSADDDIEDIIGAVKYEDTSENSAMLKTLFPYDQGADLDLVTDLPANTPALLSIFELYAERENLQDFLDFSKKLKRYLISRDRIGRREGLSVINWAWANAKKDEQKDDKR
jgi:hypothetical protein